MSDLADLSAARTAALSEGYLRLVEAWLRKVLQARLSPGDWSILDGNPGSGLLDHLGYALEGQRLGAAALDGALYGQEMTMKHHGEPIAHATFRLRLEREGGSEHAVAYVDSPLFA